MSFFERFTDKIYEIFGSRPKNQKISVQLLRAEPFAEPPPPPDEPFIWNYSDQYRAISGEGHNKPPPSFGSPTFVWHIGIWQTKQSDEDQSDGHLTDIRAKFQLHDTHNTAFYEEINKFIKGVQAKGRVLKTGPNGSTPDANIDGFQFTEYRHPYGAAAEKPLPHTFRDYQPQSMSFTLWWLDSGPDGKPLDNARLTAQELRDSHYSALRVRVQVQTHFDHVTISFFIDAAKPYGSSQIYTTAEKSGLAFGRRRKRIAEGLEKIRQVSKAQISKGLIEVDRVPEQGLSQQDADDLLATADYFYDGIWRDFMHSFGIEPSAWSGVAAETLVETQGERFADFRGLVMSVPGLDTPRNKARKSSIGRLRDELKVEHPTDPLRRSANTGIGPFDVFDHRNNEPNTVLKSFWPFIRRITPWADYREFVGCGLVDWRALYVTALGASGSFYVDDEAPGRKAEVPSEALPTEPEGPLSDNYPVRYLVLTKGEPHREQIGRFVERINALGTKRLFALKNLSVVKNAGVHLRLLGRELDGVLQYWGDRRERIESWFQAELEVIRTAREPPPPEKDVLGRRIDMAAEAVDAMINAEVSAGYAVKKEHELTIPSRAEQELGDERVRRLSELVKSTERKLVKLGAALDNIGNGGAGRILYVINRSKYHIEEFERMWPTLEVGNIDGWINYGQFVRRGLMPTFSMIRATGDRLLALRGRLQSITEMIQTSALIIETEATRSNTETLRRITNNIYYISTPIYAIAGLLLAKMLPDGHWSQYLVLVLLFMFLVWNYATRRRAGEL
jgi:hypothetical protein